MRRNEAKTGPAGEALWRFSLALYARPGAAEALLTLQDRAGRNVNLMLFALWLGTTRGELLDPAGLAAAEAAIAPLDGGLVMKLRALRRRLKGAGDRDAEALLQRLLGLELAAERRVQQVLAARLGERLRPEIEDRLAAAAANLALYLGDENRSEEARLLHHSVATLARRPSRR